MFSIFVEEKIATIGMLTCFFVSILLRLSLAALYQRMIRETDNMATTNNKLLKQCKLKFSNCYQLNNGVSNVQVFVEKFLNKLAIGPFSFRLLYHLSGQFMLLSVVFSGVGVCRRIVAGSMFGEILPFYICTMLGLYLYFSLSTLLDIRGKRKVLKINLIDYLENHLSCRMQVTREDMQMLYGTQAARISTQESVPQIGKHTGRAGAAEAPRSVEVMPIAGWLANRSDRTCAPALDPEESEELELLLKEILTLS